MKLVLIFTLFLVSCAHQDVSRGPASIDTEFWFGEISAKTSRVRFFPAKDEIYFYIEARDASNKYVDIEAQDISIYGSNKRKLSHRLIRQLRGRYYVELNNSKDIDINLIDFRLQGKVLREQFKRPLKPVSAKTSKISIRKKKSGVTRMRLKLLDVNGKSVELPSIPEIISSSNSVEIENLEHVKEGIWEFDLKYSEHNIITYLSVRAHGVYLENLFRFQHVEK